VQVIEQVQKDIGMPIGVQTRFQGAAEAFQASLSSTLLLILAAVVTMYIVLGVLYESYIHPVTILSTCPRRRWAPCWRCCSAAMTWA
jgi:multidrug efflux pump